MSAEFNEMKSAKFAEPFIEVTLGSAVEKINMGSTPRRDERSFWGPGTPWLTISDLNGKSVRYSRNDVTALASKKMRLVRKGTLMMSFKLTIGRMAFAGRDLYTNEAICHFINPRIDKEFLYYAIPFSDIAAGGQLAVKGNTLNKSSLNNATLFVPSDINEQRSIAAVLSDTDSLIEALEALLIKKRAIMAATAEILIMEGVRLPGQNGQRVSRILGDIVKMRRERVSTFGTSRSACCVDLEDLQSGTSRVTAFRDLSKKTGVRFGFKVGDVLFGRLRVYLRKYWRASCDGVCSTEIWPLTADEKGITSSYLAHVVKTDAFMLKASVSSGTHMPRADWGITSQMEISLPVSLDEQKAIASVLSDMDAEIHALQDKIRKTRMLKSAMAEELLTGQTRMLVEIPTN